MGLYGPAQSLEQGHTTLLVPPRAAFLAHRRSGLEVLHGARSRTFAAQIRI